MWIQVRSMDGKTTHKIDGLSKLTKIEEVRSELVELFDALPEQQRLFYRGKQLENGHSLFDYDVRQNDLIQIMVRKNVPKPLSQVVSKPKEDPKEADKAGEGSDKENVEPCDKNGGMTTPIPAGDSKFKLGDILDARDPSLGSWHEVTLTKLRLATELDNSKLKSVIQSSAEDNSEPFPVREKADDVVYEMLYDGYESDGEAEVRSCDLRPRARHLIPFTEVKAGDKVMINYNMDEPKQRGYWYDAVVTGKKDTRTNKELYCTIFFGEDLAPLHDCTVVFPNEIFKIEPDGSQKNINLDGVAATPTRRTNKPNCDFCLDNPTKKCRECACNKCGGKDRPNLQIICDECDLAWHISCLDPPLASIPDVDEWYCHLCKNDETEVVRAGEKLKASKKKAKMASANSKSTRDWGKGMATVGRTTECTIVPANHFGPIPGVEVGTMWKFRVQVSEAGVHRPHVAGIAARESEGAFSIVLSGGYEDDVDKGDEFEYTGSGGRDLSGNKRTAEQSSDQKLTKSNLGLARNCDASINAKAGATAKDWRAGKPVRVVRNCKLAKHSKYAPEEGNRYDGIYKLVKYWPEKGKSGFLVWRYLFRRDDPSPAPWTKAGKKRAKELGLEMQYPEGYEEKKKLEEEEQLDKKKKRKSSSKDTDNETSGTPAKRAKVATYKPSRTLKQKIDSDELNTKLWQEAMSNASEGQQVFMSKLQEIFACICCQDLVYKPVTTECRHNFCKSCIQRSFKCAVYTCPSCRFDLGQDNKLSTNETLGDILLEMFPGYGAGR